MNRVCQGGFPPSQNRIELVWGVEGGFPPSKMEQFFSFVYTISGYFQRNPDMTLDAMRVDYVFFVATLLLLSNPVVAKEKKVVHS